MKLSRDRNTDAPAMMIAPKPENEARRLKALLDLCILDTDREPEIDSLVSAVAEACGVPMAMVSLVDDNRQWFKSKIGVEADQTDRDIAFCAHTILTDQPLIVPDSEKDVRFFDNPLAIGSAQVRAYLGASLKSTDGYRIGTLCAADNQPHDWTAREIKMVSRVAEVVSALINQRQGLEQIRTLSQEVAELSDKLALERDCQTKLDTVTGLGGWQFDPRGNSLTWSRNARLLHGVDENYSPTIARAIEFFDEETRSTVLHALERALESPESFDLDLPMTTARGVRRWVRFTGAPILRDGGVARIVGAYQDVSETRRARSELTDALAHSSEIHNQLKALQEALGRHAIVSSTDRNGTITMVNDKFCELTGYKRDELIGQNHRLINSGHHPQAFFERMYQTIKAGQIWHDEICDRNRDGEYIWFDAMIVPMLDQRGVPQQFVSIRFDITERVRATNRLEAALERAEEATRAKSTFLANMSHEIRTPLNGVLGLAEVLERTKLDQKQLEMVSLIRTSGETLQTLLNDILDISKIEAGKLSVENAPFDLKKSIEAAAHVMKARAEQKGLDFSLDFADDAQGTFRGDAVRIRQIVSNLASNAVKFTKEGAVSIAISAQDDPRETDIKHIQIAVRDTGIGFDEETGKRLFQRFEQADGSITRSYGGTGLGLSICDALASLMGGTVKATSVPGEGSVFTLKLPLEMLAPAVIVKRNSGSELPKREAPKPVVKPASAQTAPGQTAIDAPVEQKRLSPLHEPDEDSAEDGLKVLLAEDHGINQRVVSLMLQPFDAIITIANNGQEALDHFMSERFDIILMDMQMPVLDGMAATAKIREIEMAEGRIRTPIAMLSANAMPEHIEAALAVGCDSHIAKPVTAETLAKGMNDASEKAEMWMEKAANMAEAAG